MLYLILVYSYQVWLGLARKRQAWNTAAQLQVILNPYIVHRSFEEKIYFCAKGISGKSCEDIHKKCLIHWQNMRELMQN